VVRGALSDTAEAIRSSVTSSVGLNNVLSVNNTSDIFQSAYFYNLGFNGIELENGAVDGSLITVRNSIGSIATLLTLSELRAKQIAKTRLHIAYEREDGAGNVYVDSFYAYITNSSDTGELNSVASFTIDFIIDGEITQTFTNVS